MSMEKYQEQTQRILERMKGIGTKLAVISGKGGVGKSIVSSLMASALVRKSGSVGVLDADVTGPSIPRMFGTQVRPMMDESGIIPPETGSGIRIMSINLLLDSEGQPVIWRGPLISGTIRQFLSDVNWGSLDYLVVDLPPGTGDATLTVMQSIPLDGIVVVTSPQDLVRMIVEKSVNMARTMNIPILGLIENMSGIKCTHCGEWMEPFGRSKGKETADRYGIEFLGRIPIDPEIARCCDSGDVEKYESEEIDTVVSGLLAALKKSD